MSEISRRGFLVGCSAAIAAMAGGRLGYVAFGSPLQEPTQEILIVVFLRGGMDGLSAVMPIAGNDRGYYENNRADIAVPTTGNNAALRLTDFFGLHPAGAPLHGLYQDKKLAIVHATGLISDTRSHFDAMKYMELGTPGSKSATNGWLTRHLQTSPATGNNAIMPALSVGNLSPTSLAGSTEAIGMSSASGFEFGGNSRYNTNQRQMVRKMYDGASWLHEAGLQTLDAVDVVEFGNPGNYTPENGANYPNNSFGRNLQTVAQMIKLQLGLKVATVDLGGWDTHDSQGNSGTGYFSNQFGTLAGGLAAFMTDLSNSSGTDHTKRVTVVVMSEFGRTFKQNASRGTDHGHGNVMLVLGGNVNGGKVYGAWPGLHTEQLYDRRDLDITTDYRQILSEILIRRMGNPNLGAIFPGYRNYQPLQLVQGSDLPPNYDTPTATPTPTPLPGSTIPTNSSQQVYLPLISR
ncbi:MAG: DUF1501 domain-containing protein [Caldilineaceae bacterium]